jgi:hypothetical protein
VFREHKTQLKEAVCWFYLFRILRVLSLSWTNNQKKNLMLVLTRRFPIHLKIGWAQLDPRSWQ